MKRNLQKQDTIERELILQKGCVIVANKGHSQYLEWPSLAIKNLSNGQTKLKWFFQAEVSSKKQMNEFDFTTLRRV